MFLSFKQLYKLWFHYYSIYLKDRVIMWHFCISFTKLQALKLVRYWKSESQYVHFGYDHFSFVNLVMIEFPYRFQTQYDVSWYIKAHVESIAILLLWTKRLEAHFRCVVFWYFNIHFVHEIIVLLLWIFKMLICRKINLSKKSKSSQYSSPNT